MAVDLFDLGYLNQGTPRQREAGRVIHQLGIWTDLERFTPALAGTIPLAVDVDGSDLDVICAASDLGSFAEWVRRLYSKNEDFRLYRSPVRGVDSVVAGFVFEGWVFEVFAQAVPVREQLACVHLLVEERLLRLGGEAAREAIRERKRRGMKTEPAFADLFGIQGDAYLELARLAEMDDEGLRREVRLDRSAT